MVINAERCSQVIQKCAQQMNRYNSIIDSANTTFQHQWKTNHVNIKHLPLFLHIDKQTIILYLYFVYFFEIMAARNKTKLYKIKFIEFENIPLLSGEKNQFRREQAMGCIYQMNQMLTIIFEVVPHCREQTQLL